MNKNNIKAPNLAIITRTKNRPMLLARALSSILAQSFTDFIWVVVNDGGEQEPLLPIVESAENNGVSVLLLNTTCSKGMEAASNMGIKQSESEYIVLLDDDDTWESDFLATAINFLDAREEYLGVVSQSNKIVEKVLGDNIQTVSKSPLNPSLNAIHIAQLVIENQFQTNAFVYRRKAYERVGSYDESMPVLGDWDFNLRVALEGDIGVIPEPLANYHVRESQQIEQYNNSITAGLMKHYEVDAEYRNKKIREDLKHNQIGLGFLLLQGRQALHSVKAFDKLTLVSDFFHALYKLAVRLRLNKLFSKLR